MNTVEIKSVDAALVRRAADEYAARLLATRASVEELIVFGSFAEGTYAPGSDLDIFIVLSESDKPARDRISDFLSEAFPVPMDLFPFTRAEMDQMESSPLLKAVRKSKWRYQRAQFSRASASFPKFAHVYFEPEISRKGAKAQRFPDLYLLFAASRLCVKNSFMF